MGNKLQKVYADQIKRWASAKNTDLTDGSMVESLAEELAKNAYAIHSVMETEWLSEDVEYVADEIMGIDLDDEDKAEIVERYRNSDAYGHLDIESVEYYIRQVRDENIERLKYLREKQKASNLDKAETYELADLEARYA